MARPYREGIAVLGKRTESGEDRAAKAEAELEHFRSGDGVAYGKAVAAADRVEAATAAAAAAAAAAAVAGGAVAAADGGVVARTKGRFW